MHLLLSVSTLPPLQEITPLPLSRVYSPLIVLTFIAERLQLSDRRFLPWLDSVWLDVQSLLTCDYLVPFSPM